MSEPRAPSGALPSTPGHTAAPARPTFKPIPLWVIAAGIPVMVVVAAAAVWLLLGFGVDSDKLDAIRTGGTLGVGLGGMVVLWLAVRRQRSTELDLLQKYEAHQLAERVASHNESHQVRVAQDARDDATERRFTDLYTKAVEQLGSDKAPVRLGGLYALERLAQNDPNQRQTIVNVLCAYLRMPFSESSTQPQLPRRRPIRPARPLALRPPSGQLSKTATPDATRLEGEVRLTAQRILETHLQPGPDSANPVGTFWTAIALDLTGAVLTDINLSACRINTAVFTRARFIGDARFIDTQFAGEVTCNRAEFRGRALFAQAQFTESVDFAETQFTGEVALIRTRFFKKATFTEPFST